MTSPELDAGRRHWLARVAALALAGCSGSGGLAPSDAGTDTLPDDAALLDDLERRTFDYFWDTANPANGLCPDRWPGRAPMASVAATGFGLVACTIGVDRGFVSRAQALGRALTTARFFDAAPQGPQAAGMAGHRGFFYHFLHMDSGARFDAGVELSSIDTGWLLAGLLHVQSYFDGVDAAETELRRLVDQIYGRVDWPWMQLRPGLISMGWNPERGFDGFIDYHGYDEAMLMVLLAMGSPTRAASADSWRGYTSTYARTSGTFMGQTHVGGAPMFWHQYSHLWIDFRGILDEPMRARGFDYFENARRATLAQRAYAIANPAGFSDYGADVWGLTACDGPGMLQLPDRNGRLRQFFDYRARGAGLADTQDDGTIAPTAALSSLPFAPEVVLPALREMRRRFGATVYGRYGFLDAFNTSFVAADATLSNGRVVPGFGWVDTDYLGIDQGPILGMIANHRNELVWRTMRTNPHLRRGLQRAGFGGGWLGG